MKKGFLLSIFIILAVLLLSAGCEPATYNLKLEVHPTQKGAVLGEGEYEEGAEVELIAEPEEGYRFTGWSIRGVTVSEDERFTYTMTNKDVTVTANFEEKTYTLTLETSPDAGGEAKGAGEYKEGTQVEIEVEEAENHEFINWEIQGVEVSESKNFTYTMPDEDVTVTANFSEIIYSLEKFSEATASNWFSYTSDEVGNAFFDTEEGWLVLENYQSDGYTTTAYSGEHFDDFVLEVEARWLEGSGLNWYGIQARTYFPEHEDDEYHSYLFLISSTGHFAIQAETKEDMVILTSGYSQYINTAMGESNEITVVCNGDNLAFYVNGELLAEIEDDAFKAGDIGFRTTTTEDEPTKVGFRGLFIKTP